MRKPKVKSGRGGYRENAKRPLKYGEETEIVRFSVPKSKVPEFKQKVARILKKWEVKKEVAARSAIDGIIKKTKK